MTLLDKVVIVTGGAHGIGRALCQRFSAEGAKVVVVADIDRQAAEELGRGIQCGEWAPCNVASESEIQAVVDTALAKHGRIDLFCSNAGIAVEGGYEVPNSEWTRIWDVNVMAHVWAARAALPSMLARGEGYLLHTASAAGLLSQIGSAPYAVTKHAAVAFAEWLAITHRDRGIKVSALCPMGVHTDMLANSDARTHAMLDPTAVTPEFVAECVVKGLAEERFLILPHPEVGEYLLRKASDYDRWIRGMRRLQAELKEMH